MLISYEGKDYQFDLEDISVSQATTIKRKLNLTLLGIERGMRDADVDAIRAVYWLMLTQNGKSVDIDRVDFKPLPFMSAFADAAKAEADAAEKTESGPDDGDAPKDR